jgi:hypothetical protein
MFISRIMAWLCLLFGSDKDNNNDEAGSRHEKARQPGKAGATEN